MGQTKTIVARMTGEPATELVAYPDPVRHVASDYPLSLLPLPAYTNLSIPAFHLRQKDRCRLGRVPSC